MGSDTIRFRGLEVFGKVRWTWIAIESIGIVFNISMACLF